MPLCGQSGGSHSERVNSALVLSTNVLTCCCLLIPRAAIKRAQLLLSIKHGMARLDNVWGVGGGQRPVMFLISKVQPLPCAVSGHSYMRTWCVDVHIAQWLFPLCCR